MPTQREKIIKKAKVGQSLFLECDWDSYQKETEKLNFNLHRDTKGGRVN